MSLDAPYPFDPDKPARHQAKLEPAKPNAPVKYNDDEISTILNNVYRNAYGEEADFQSPNKAFLDKPADWHFSDIEKEIDKPGDASVCAKQRPVQSKRSAWHVFTGLLR